MNTAYDEILDFVTSAPTLAEIISFQHSPTTLERVAYLTTGDITGTITPEERDELREFHKAAEFIQQLKVRAERRLQSPSSRHG